MRIVGILLAAGEGSRFGGDKLLAPLGSQRTPQHGIEPVGVVAARNLLAALPDSIAVVRPHDAALSASLSAAGVRTIKCENASTGMGASLACGVAASEDAGGWVIALADMPWIRPATIRLVVDAIASGADIAAPTLRGARGHPVGFARAHRAALTSLTGDAGARSLIDRNAASVTWIDVDDEGVLRDVDTRMDLR
ncbi:MAG TPA: nucleotidyltransferase family protein [Casimicrobiaceae bacterium]|nr:nucleotidyltransferase family protein [Casimicrobiaceae bacterium]